MLRAQQPLQVHDTTYDILYMPSVPQAAFSDPPPSKVSQSGVCFFQSFAVPPPADSQPMTATHMCVHDPTAFRPREAFDSQSLRVCAPGSANRPHELQIMISSQFDLMAWRLPQ